MEPPGDGADGGERTFLTRAQKRQLRAFWAADAALGPAEVSAWALERFGRRVGRATLYRIARAPASAFSGGRASAKKPRRVKFPALERELLAFCERRRGERRALADEELLREAAAVRERLGIPSDALKLSNGWLHSFKGRHELREPVRAGVNEQEEEVEKDLEVVEEEERTAQSTATAAHSVEGTKQVRRSRERSPARQQGQKKTDNELTTQGAGNVLAGQLQVPTTTQNRKSQPLQQRPRAIAPLVYISAKALCSVQAGSFFNWEKVSGMLDAEVFAVVNEGICVRRGGMFQLNIDVVHSEAVNEISLSPSVIFKVWNDDVEVLGECSSRLLQENGVALSAFQLQTTLPTDSVVRVEFLAPGFAFHSSRIVLKLECEQPPNLAATPVATLML